MDFGPRDRFGVPARFFGVVDDDFYGLIGRIVMMAAVLEDRLITLRTVIREPIAHQATYAGKPSSELIKGITKELGKRPDGFRATGEVLIGRLERAFDRRNDVVHSLWPNPTMEHAFGHRTVTKSRRLTDGDHSATVTTDGPQLMNVVHELADLYGEVRDFEYRIQWPENKQIDQSAVPAAPTVNEAVGSGS